MRVSDVPFVHSTTAAVESSTWPYTWSRTCCSANPRRCSSSAYASGRSTENTGSGGGGPSPASTYGASVGQLLDDPVRRVVDVGRHLHGELPAGAEQRGPLGQHPLVVGHPLEGGVREHDVDRPVDVERGDVALVEAQPTAGVRRGLGQHRVGRVDPERLGGAGRARGAHG